LRATRVEDREAALLRPNKYAKIFETDKPMPSNPDRI